MVSLFPKCDRRGSGAPPGQATVNKTTVPNPRILRTPDPTLTMELCGPDPGRGLQGGCSAVSGGPCHQQLLQRERLEGQCWVQRLSHHPGPRHPRSQSSSSLQSQLPAHAPSQAAGDGSLVPKRETGQRPWLWAPTWGSSNCHGHWESEPEDGGSLSAALPSKYVFSKREAGGKAVMGPRTAGGLSGSRAGCVLSASRGHLRPALSLAADSASRYTSGHLARSMDPLSRPALLPGHPPQAASLRDGSGTVPSWLCGPEARSLANLPQDKHRLSTEAAVPCVSPGQKARGPSLSPETPDCRRRPTSASPAAKAHVRHLAPGVRLRCRALGGSAVPRGTADPLLPSFRISRVLLGLRRLGSGRADRRPRRGANAALQRLSAVTAPHGSPRSSQCLRQPRDCLLTTLINHSHSVMA